MSYLQQNKEKGPYARKHLIFEVQSPLSPDLNHLDFYLWEHKNRSAFNSN
jgi:hypothetical protein